MDLIIEEVVDIDDTDPIHLLYEAATRGKLDVIKRLVEIHGIDIIINNPHIMLSASFNGRLEVVKYLYESKLFNSLLLHQVLMHAIIKNDIDIVKYLVKNGIDVNMNDGEALFQAKFSYVPEELISPVQTDIVDFLVENGAKCSETIILKFVKI